jgi:hypothetical protein
MGRRVGTTSTAVVFVIFFALCAAVTTLGVYVSPAMFLSSDINATCSQYRTAVCGPNVISGLQNHRIHHFTEYTTPSTDSCINTANNCSAHPPLIYQFLYENDNIAFTFRIKWNPDSRVECTPNVYHVLIKQERDNSLNLSTCNDFVSTSKLFLVNTSYNDFYYQKPFTGGRPRNIYYIKVVAHPLYEYPTLKFSAPTGCTNQFDGCQVCDTSCSGKYNN